MSLCFYLFSKSNLNLSFTKSCDVLSEVEEAPDVTFFHFLSMSSLSSDQKVFGPFGIFQSCRPTPPKIRKLSQF